MSGFESAWPLYYEIHTLCKEMGVHTNIAAHLAAVLETLGCEHVSDVYGVPLESIAKRRGIGPRALMVARQLGARKAVDDAGA